jgi:transposase
MGTALKKYTQEYKAEAIELVVSSGRPVAEIARDLGLNEGTLGNWVNSAKRTGDVKSKPLNIDERVHMKELEEENRKLRMERDFLKKVCHERERRLEVVK